MRVGVRERPTLISSHQIEQRLGAPADAAGMNFGCATSVSSSIDHLLISFVKVTGHSWYCSQ